ncbi:MAG: aminotransferase class V-fold PLP-dependent enzyme [Xanthomonadales bacterium]|nr:aminotransferase class V-fold PLP-dependent enzyme [Xanthomonadales bacterium]NIX13483.1 aminotransferase class V-fold PLP-dependent enzyme [Xanthomonadales bacterium]
MGIHADHAAISPWPEAAAEAVRNFADENLAQGARGYAAWLSREKRLRERVAGMLNALTPGDIAFTRNTSEGVCIVANGIDWRPGDNVVTPAGEFPTNRLAWDSLGSAGVDIRRVDIRAAEDPEVALINAMDGRTRVLTVSSVQWQDGFRLRLPVLGAQCRAAGVLFFVDAIQEFGALRMDVRASGIDCLSAGSHKWQMGPEGMAVFYSTPGARSSLRLAQFGWRMLERPYRHEMPDRPCAESASRFETGSPNMLGQAALDASTGLLHDVGMHEVERRVLDNTRRLLEGIHAIPGLEPVSNTADERLSGIVAYRHDRLDTREMLSSLRSAGVTAAVRAGAIRLSPHFYQYARQIDALLEAMERAAKANK